MAKFRKSFIALALALTIALTLGMTACSPKKPEETEKVYTYRTYTTTSPSNWNLLTQQDNNDRQVSNYLNSSFFEFDFKRDANGEIIDGAFNIHYSAATKLEDVTATYAGNEKYGIPAGTTGNRAWKLTLRDDLKWNDGSAITADDFIYSMKETLNSKFMNRLASQYYGANMILHNAKSYAYSNYTGYVAATDAYDTYSEDIDSKLVFSIGSSEENSENYDGSVSYVREWLNGYGYSSYTAKQAAEVYIAQGIENTTVDEMVALEGKTFAEIKADATLKATWDNVIAWWQTEPNEELHFFIAEYTYPEFSFDNVGFFKTGDLELVIIFDNTFEFLDEDGNLTYEAPYYLQDLPLVKQDLYEASKKEPVAGAKLWTSTYCSSIETTASWGPYMLTNFQAGSTYTLSKNPNWYGYGMKEYEGQYQTDQIVCRTIPEWETAWKAFQLGEIDEIGIDPTIASTYRTSSQAVFTPSDLVASIHIQTSADALRNNETDGVNKTILLQEDFRKALSLAIDRAAYAQAATTSSLAGLGYFNSMHYYDVAHGGRYRDTDVAKKALLRAYGAEDLGDGKWKVGETTYNNVDDASEALTGYNLTLARQLVTSAYNKAKEAGDIKDTDKVVLKFGTSEDNAASRRHYNFLNNAWTELMKGTPLQDRFETTFDGSYGNQWSKSFRSGAYEIAPASGFSGGAWNPYYFIGAEVNYNESIRYNSNWDTRAQSFEFTIKNAAGADETYNLSIQGWYDALNGLDSAPEQDGKRLDFSMYPVDSKLAIVAELEYYALTSYWDIPTFYSFSAELHSYKTEYATYEYNTFMSYGGVRYMTYNYSDAEWASYVASQPNGTLDYAK